ncbi:MAG TPA: cupin domain-containing protein [Candidatus Eremiobacteraceae bacterium]|nr:cupin domain-containing protein [Candidatus Eremiobacteraceae bacterium]
MNTTNIEQAHAGFIVLQTLTKSQTAIMTLQPGEWSGGFGNEHPESEQTLLVFEGEVVAEIGEERTVLRRGDVVVVPRKVPHRFGNDSDSPAITFNVYAPPAY